MKIRQTLFKGKPFALIYVTAEERQQEEVKAKIAEVKSSCKQVAVFVGGHEPIEDVIRGMIEDRLQGS